MPRARLPLCHGGVRDYGAGRGNGEEKDVHDR